MPRLLCVCLLAASVVLRAAEAPEPGQTYFGRNQYIEYIAGTLPFVLSAAHGGRDKPAELPDRTKGTFAFDTNTQELARAIDDEFVARTGQHPHVIICRVTRRKIDCNREIVEGAGGHPLTEQSWKDFQGFIQTAQKAVVSKHGKGFYIDLHGHGHADATYLAGVYVVGPEEQKIIFMVQAKSTFHIAPDVADRLIAIASRNIHGLIGIGDALFRYAE